MSKRRKNAGAGYGYMFSGAFSEKKDAVAKEKKRKGSFVKGIPTRHGYRYVVMTPRDNPPAKRKKKISQNWVVLESGTIRARFSTRKAANRYAKDARRFTHHPVTVERGTGENPMDLVVMGANPGAGSREITVQPGQTITLRVNPERSTEDDSRYMRQAAQELFGKTLEQLTPRELSQVARQAARLKLAQRDNSFGSYLGWSPGPIGSKSERAARRREFQARVREQAKEMRQEYRRLHRSARASFKDKKKLEGLFHEVYGQNPAICGKMIGGYPCTRKPGHAGPHLPQGATLRPRSRHNWGPRGNPSADELRESFAGCPADRVDLYDEPHMPRGNYALLGKLLALYVKPLTGGQVIEIHGKGVKVVADESAQQIYFVGGDQDMDPHLEKFGAQDIGGGRYELGEATRIDYKQRKEHVADPDLDEWRHQFGEENGIRPRVLYAPAHKRLLLEGGDYRITERGIEN